jgi:hypothetical protein
MILEDGSAECDRCAEPLAGYGVLTGLVADNAGQLLIFCYVNECRSVVTHELIHFTTAGVCSTTGQSVTRSSGDAIVAADLDPADPTSARQLTFCRELGCADQFLAQTGTE